MHDYTTCLKFTTKRHLHEILLNLWHLCVVFTRILFSSVLLWKFFNNETCSLYLKVVLGGEMCLSYGIIHNIFSVRIFIDLNKMWPLVN